MDHTVVVSGLGAYAEWSAPDLTDGERRGTLTRRQGGKAAFLPPLHLGPGELLFIPAFRSWYFLSHAKISPASGAHAFQLDLFSHFQFLSSSPTIIIS